LALPFSHHNSIVHEMSRATGKRSRFDSHKPTVIELKQNKNGLEHIPSWNPD